MVQLKRRVQSVVEDVEQLESTHITGRIIGWYSLEKYFEAEAEPMLILLTQQFHLGDFI